MGGRRRQKQRSGARGEKNADGIKSCSSFLNPWKRQGQILSIHDLPPEMLTEILKFVDTRSLLQCRGVNKKWLQFSSRLLRGRPEMEMDFHFQGGEFGFLQHCSYDGGTKGLEEFIDLFQDTKKHDCPISRFSFVDASRRESINFFDHHDYIQFLSDFKIPAIKSLKLELEFFTFEHLPDDIIDIDHLVDYLGDNYADFLAHRDNYVYNLVDKVRDLLLHQDQVPQLEEFGLSLPPRGFNVLPETRITFFPHLSPQENNHVSNVNPLANLKVLHFQHSMFEDYPGISKQLLNAAVNLKRVQVYQRSDHRGNCSQILTPSAFEFLHSVGKLGLVREAEIQLTEEFFDTAKKYKNPPPAFKLTSVNISNQIIQNPNQSTLKDAKTFVQNLVESCKISLRKLEMEPLGFLTGFQFPMMENLSELSLKSARGHSDPFFSAGIRNLNIFPAVRHLDVEFLADCATGFPAQESIPILPHVQTLRLNDKRLSQAHVPLVALLCPNLTTFQIRREKWSAPCLNFFEIGPLIWTHMKGLEHLEIDIDVDLEAHDYRTLDSVFTGMTKETCQRLFDLEEACGLLKKWEIGVEIPESKLEARRELPSILDMKDLKKLTVNPFSGETLLDKENLFKSKLTWISQEYAFKLMPHLNVS